MKQWGPGPIPTPWRWRCQRCGEFFTFLHVNYYLLLSTTSLSTNPHTLKWILLSFRQQRLLKGVVLALFRGMLLSSIWWVMGQRCLQEVLLGTQMLGASAAACLVVIWACVERRPRSAGF